MAGVEEQDQQTAPKTRIEPEGTSTESLKSQDVSFIEKPVKEIARKTAKKVATKVASKAAEDTVKKNLPRFTEILGVFVALFTFVSINIQIFSRITLFNNALVFVTLEFLCLAGFVIILDLLIFQQKPRIFLIVVILFAVLIPVFLLLLPKTPLSVEEKPKTNDLEQRVNILEKRLDDHVIRRLR